MRPPSITKSNTTSARPPGATTRPVSPETSASRAARAFAHCNLGYVRQMRGDLVRAIQSARRSLGMCEELGTDVFHAAILLWAAAIAHIVAGNVDFGLVAAILLGSIPGVWLGSHVSVRLPSGLLRTALGTVMIAAGIAFMLLLGRRLLPDRTAAPPTDAGSTTVSELAAEYKDDREVRRLFDLAMKLEGLPGRTRAYFEEYFPELNLPASLDGSGWWNNRPFETDEDCQRRAQSVLAELLARHSDREGEPEQRIVFVSHGGFFGHLVCAMLNIPWRQASNGLKSWFVLNNCSISRFDIRHGEVLISYLNRTDHLPTNLITG